MNDSRDTVAGKELAACLRLGYLGAPARAKRLPPAAVEIWVTQAFIIKFCSRICPQGEAQL